LRVSNGVIFGRTAKGGGSAIGGMGMGGCREMGEDRRLAVGGSLGRWIFRKERAWLGKSCCWWRDTEVGLFERRADFHAGLELRACWWEDGDWRFRVWFQDCLFSLGMCNRGLRNDTCGSIGWLETEECSRHVIGMSRCLWHADIPSCYEYPLVLGVDCALGLASASYRP